MQITMADAATMALRFPYSANAVQRIKGALPRRTWDKPLGAWLVPVTDFEMVMAAYPEMQAAPEVWEAAYPCTAKVDAETAKWCQSLANSGVRFAISSRNRVRVEHDFAPAADLARLQDHVDERAASICRLLAAGRHFTQQQQQQQQPPAASAVTQPESIDLSRGKLPQREPTSLERAYIAGIHNAVVIEARQKAIIERNKRRRFESRQQQATMFGTEDGADE